MHEHRPIIDKCKGCEWEHDGYCIPYLEPLSKWRSGNCPMATHLVRKQEKKQKLNPIKAAKRAAKLGKDEL